MPGRKHKPGRAPADPRLWLYGIHAVAAALRNPERRSRRLLVTEAGQTQLAAWLGTAWPPPLEVEPAARPDITRVLPPGAVHQGVALAVEPLADADLRSFAAPAGAGVVVVLDQVSDPHNVGAILRTADAFGARGLVLQARHAPEESGAMAKAASGALEWVPIARPANLAQALDALKGMGYWCVGLDADADTDFSEADLDPRTALVLGAEGSGLRRLTRDRCDLLARLPIGGRAGSLNVSNAAAVALYEIARQRRRRAPSDK